MSTRRLAAVVALVLVAGVSACSSSDDRSADEPRSTTTGPTSSTTPAACTPARVPASTGGEQSIDVGGSARTYLLDLPDGYDGRTAVPIVFDVHGWNSNAAQQDERTQMAAKGTDRGYVVVTPQALGSPTNWRLFGEPDPQDDYAFVRTLVEALDQQLCIDADRVYAAGHSAGSAFVGFFVCRQPHVWAAAAMVSAAVPTTCPEGVRPSVAAIAGTADPAVPYEGGAIPGEPAIGGFLNTFVSYVDKYGCTGEVRESSPEPGVEARSVDGCQAGARVRFYTVVGGTHAWPGSSAAREDAANSAAGRTWDATSAILDFFDANPRRDG